MQRPSDLIDNVNYSHYLHSPTPNHQPDHKTRPLSPPTENDECCVKSVTCAFNLSLELHFPILLVLLKQINYKQYGVIQWSNIRVNIEQIL